MNRKMAALITRPPSLKNTIAFTAAEIVAITVTIKISRFLTAL